MRAIQIDDEQHCLDSLRSMIENYLPEVELIAESNTVAQGLQLINLLKPDIVFLDVEMPQSNGFELLDLLEEHQIQVIFITAHDKYALKAIKYCAMDFLVKPVQILDLKSAIKKAYKQKGKNNSIEIYNTNAKQANESLKRLVLPSTDGFEIKEIKDIIQLESNDNYTWVYTTEKQKILVCRTLKEFDEMLENAGFVRIHQSHLVNEQHVVRYIKGSGGYVQLSDGTVLEVSRRKKDEFINRFMYK